MRADVDSRELVEGRVVEIVGVEGLHTRMAAVRNAQERDRLRLDAAVAFQALPSGRQRAMVTLHKQEMAKLPEVERVHLYDWLVNARTEEVQAGVRRVKQVPRWRGSRGSPRTSAS